jgi:bifunctional non-homologous end joining protein LigD
MTPRVLLPMLAAEADRPFSHPAWLFEVKWDGIRCLAEDRRMRSRRGVDITRRFPEVAACLPPGLTLDGELVVPLDGRPDFDAVMDRFRLADPGRIDRQCAVRPATLIAFDLLADERGDLCARPLSERRRRLLQAVRPGAALRVNAAVDGDGLGLWEVVRRQEWEGIVAKRKDGVYRPGERSDAWLKVKNRRVFDGVIVGARGDGHLLVAGPSGQGIVASVAAGVSRELFRALRDGSRLPPIPCRVSHVGRTARGRLREPVLLPL